MSGEEQDRPGGEEETKESADLKQELNEDEAKTSSAPAEAAESRPPLAAAGGGPPPHEGMDPRWRGREGGPPGPYPEYPPMYPPPPEGGYPPGGMHPFPGGYPHPAYGPPMNYGMYPPYQPGPYPGQFPPPYGYPHDPMGHGPPRYPGDPGAQYQEGVARGSSRKDDGDGTHEGSEDYYDEEEKTADTSSASRVRLYVKSKVPTRQEVIDRRARKNAQSRARAEKLRNRIASIEMKAPEERTEEEQELFDNFQSRRQRKNDRSRDRAIEKKNEIERILSKPEKRRSQIEIDFLRTALTAKQRKNEGDRLRRQRIKMIKKGGRPEDAEALTTPSHRAPRHHYGSGMSDIPVSPLPSGVPRHHHLPSPGAFASPGMMGYPPGSPGMRRPGGPPGDYRGHPYMPPHPAYGAMASPATRGQLHMPQQSGSVEQHRHPDGSMTISIGGEGQGGPHPPYERDQARLSPPGEMGPSGSGAVNLSDMLMYGDNADAQEREPQADAAGEGQPEESEGKSDV